MSSIPGGRPRRVDGERGLAFVGLTALTGAYASVLWRVTDVVGGSPEFAAVVVASIALAALVGRYVGVRVALGVTSGLLFLGLLTYLFALPQSQVALLTPERVVNDTLALLTGLSILRLVGAGVWAIAVVPGPVFLSWYLAVRRRYVSAVVAGSLALALVVLTGDADAVATVVGVLGATTTVAASTFERHGGGLAQADVLTALLAAMIVVSATFSVVPGAAGSPLLPDRGAPTVEASIVESRDNVDIVGSIRLSPDVRFTVESPRSEYWQTAAYDRYTGDGWVRTGNTRPYDGRLSDPPGSTRELEQTVTAEAPLSILPAAWKPVDVDGAVASETVVTPQGGIRPETTLQAGENYTVTSRVPNATSERLRAAGTDYPDRVSSSYLQLPESTTDRVRERAETVAGEEETPYDKAVAIESYLEENKEYSLSVPRPTGDVADAFLFEMDAGYCTYYATTMVVMLRSQGVPARFVTGYTSGEDLGNGTHVVRGLHSHAWVEVYFPDTGWVRFDPTPSGPRQTAEDARIAEAQQSGLENIDYGEPNGTTPIPSNGTDTPNGTGAESPSTPGEVTTTDPTNGTQPPADGFAEAVPTAGPSDGGAGPFPTMPTRRTLVVALIGLVGVAAGARRTTMAERAIGLLSVQFQRRRDPDSDVRRAYDRLGTLLEREHRARRPGETPRAYVESLPTGESRSAAEARRVVELYERAQYGDGVTEREADEAVSTVDRLVRASTPILRWLR
jgi:transglutaminase-like putative cysteine protease